MPRKRRTRWAGSKVVHLRTQADRARKIAAECSSPLVAELLEIHARRCELNADARQQKGGKAASAEKA